MACGYALEETGGQPHDDHTCEPEEELTVECEHGLDAGTCAVCGGHQYLGDHDKWEPSVEVAYEPITALSPGSRTVIVGYTHPRRLFIDAIRELAPGGSRHVVDYRHPRSLVRDDEASPCPQGEWTERSLAPGAAFTWWSRWTELEVEPVEQRRTFTRTSYGQAGPLRFGSLQELGELGIHEIPDPDELSDDPFDHRDAVPARYYPLPVKDMRQARYTR